MGNADLRLEENNELVLHHFRESIESRFFLRNVIYSITDNATWENSILFKDFFGESCNF